MHFQNDTYCVLTLHTSIITSTMANYPVTVGAWLFEGCRSFLTIVTVSSRCWDNVVVEAKGTEGTGRVTERIGAH